MEAATSLMNFNVMIEKQTAKRAVIFDRDGVLTCSDEDKIKKMCHSLSLSMETLNQLRQLLMEAFSQLHQLSNEREARIGFPQNIDEEQRFFADYIAREGASLSLNTWQTQELKKLHPYQFLKPYMEVEGVLAEIVKRGCYIGVLSNCELVSIEYSLQHTGLLPYIHTALSSAMIGARKPEPAAYRNIAQALSVDPENCLYFDNEILMVEGARALGMEAYWVDRRSSDHRLNDHTICDLTAVMDCLDHFERRRRT